MQNIATQGNEEVVTRIISQFSGGDLIRYVQAGSLEAIRLLVGLGVDVNIPEEGGLCATALHWAVCDNSLEIVQLLLSAGANPNAQDSWGQTPLHWAAVGATCEILMALLKGGALPKLVDEDWKTPWHIAAQEHHDEVLPFLATLPEHPKLRLVR